MAIVLLHLTTLKQWEPHEKVNVNQYGQIYFKTMVKFEIDNSGQFESIVYGLGCLSVNASVHFKQN